MKNYETISVTLNGGHTDCWEASKGEWDDYYYDGTVFIIKQNGAWVGIYNMDNIISVIVK